MAKKLSDFTLQKRNINKHKVRGMGMLDNVIATDGWQGAITVAANGETFAGSARLEVSYDRFGEDTEPITVHTTGDRPVIVIRDDIPTADDPRAIRLGIADNRISELNYDPDIELLSVIAEEIDISDMYFEDELAALVEADQIDGEDTEYQDPEDQGDRGATDDIPESSVRMMQLFLDTESHPLFLEMVEALNNIYGTDNPTDCVMAGLRELCENHSVSL